MGVSLEKDGRRYTVRFERRLAHPPEKVWRALTERELLKQWFPSEVRGAWETGAKLTFVFESGAEGGGEASALEGEVLAVEPARLLEFRWGESVLRFELLPEAGGCRLIFSDSFDDGSIAARNTAGWEICLTNLESVLEGSAPAEFDLQAWRVLFRDYAAQFEPKAGSQQGAPETHPAVVAEQAAQGHEDQER